MSGRAFKCGLDSEISWVRRLWIADCWELLEYSILCLSNVIGPSLGRFYAGSLQISATSELGIADCEVVPLQYLVIEVVYASSDFISSRVANPNPLYNNSVA